MLQFVKNCCRFFYLAWWREGNGEHISRKRLQWAEISFSGTCHESRYETLVGEAENSVCGQVWKMDQCIR